MKTIRSLNSTSILYNSPSKNSNLAFFDNLNLNDFVACQPPLGDAVKSAPKSGEWDTTFAVHFAYDLLKVTEKFRVALLGIQIKVKSDVYDCSQNSRMKEIIAEAQELITLERLVRLRKSVK